MNNRIEMELNDGDKLVAEVNPNKPFREIFIGIKNKDGVWVQDLACVGQDYEINDDLTISNVDNFYKIRVWADHKSDDLTHSFLIPRCDD